MGSLEMSFYAIFHFLRSKYVQLIDVQVNGLALNYYTHANIHFVLCV